MVAEDDSINVCGEVSTPASKLRIGDRSPSLPLCWPLTQIVIDTKSWGVEVGAQGGID